MSYNIQLDPCGACLRAHPPGCDSYNYASINQCLVDTTSAFSGKLGVNGTLESTIKDNNKRCLDKVLYTMGPFNGWYNRCNHRLSAAVSFNQIPHYVPDLINKGYNKEESRNLCKMMCKRNKRNQYECINACDIDSDAVVSIQPAPTTDVMCKCYGTIPLCNNDDLYNMTMYNRGSHM